MLSIGIDVGGTKTAVALVDASDGSVLNMSRIPTRAWEGASQLGLRLTPMIADLTPAGAPLPVGVAVPELVSPDGRVLTDIVIPGLRGDPAAALGQPSITAVDSDVRAAALAEARFGAGRGRTSFAYMSIGTGIAHCFVCQGIPWPGAHGSAILLGSAGLVDSRVDTGGVPVTVEDWASGPGLLARASARGLVLESGQDVLWAAASGDARAAAAAWETGRAAGLAAASLVNLFDPEAVVIGGGLGSAAGHYWDALRDAVTEGIWDGSPFEVPVLHAETGEAAGAVGAALLAHGSV